MLKFHRSAALILACTAALGLSACAAGGAKRDTAYIARDVNTLYASAQRTMQAGDTTRRRSFSTRLSDSILILSGRAGRS